MTKRRGGVTVFLGEAFPSPSAATHKTRREIRVKVVLGAFVAVTAMGWLGLETYTLTTGRCPLTGECVMNASITPTSAHTGGSCCGADGAIAPKTATGADGAL